MAFTILHTRLADRGAALPADCLRVAHGRITAIGGPEIAQPGDTLVDGSGATLLPGLIDSHVHLAPGCVQLAATYGVTTQLDQFSMPDVVVGETPRTSVFTSGIGATAPGGHPTIAFPPIPYVTGPEDAKQFVADRIADGADHLKLIYDDGSGAMLNIPTLESRTVQALTEEAHAHGLTVVAHVSTAAGAVTVAECGVDVLAHVPSDLMTPAQIEAVAGVAVIATLGVAVDGFNGPSGHLPLLDEPELMARMPARWRRVLDHQSRRWMPPEPPDGTAARANTLALHRVGVRVLAGTDAPNPGLVFGASLHRELVHLVRAGLTPAEAVVAATSAPADVFGFAYRGRLTVGARADLLLVDGDPLTDITATQRIRQTWVEGEPIVYSDARELAGIRFLGETTARIVAALKEMWPGFPSPEDVVREDGEVLGRVVPVTGGWLPTTVFGGALGPACSRDDAVETVEHEGLASLTETWWARTDGPWQEAVLTEVQPERVRLRWRDPLLDQAPSGQWYDLTDIDLSRQPLPT
ncbi:amidohydrolase family protein [Kribbella sp. NPDC003557]|uniref:amidohydrolase family protein n=1 Tax=Kribbella sp. NPDC003557 TaxID=3154449 RepID=UPI0033AC602C